MSHRRQARLPYLAGLDGLRALSVAAVLAYHAGVVAFPGGFLGVEVFFVISGYLITALLLAQWQSGGRVELRTFWLRRARRLLPALFALLVVVTAYSAIALRGELAELRGAVVAALTYVTNWYLVVGDQSYFAALGRPSPLKHLWSLAVEEQFYLCWPLLFAAGMRATRGDARRFARIVVAGVVVSTVVGVLLYRPFADPSRVYYGTDTRAAGLLVGAALACVWAPWNLSRRTGRGAPVVLDVVGLAALAVLFAFARTAGELDAFLYRGGFLLVSVASALVIAVAVHPAARLGRVLGCAPLREIGRRSYSLYLWHWPVFVVTRPRLDVPLTGTPLLVLRLALTAALAEGSYRLVERPVRELGVRGALARLGETAGLDAARLRVRRSLAGAAFVGLVALLAVQLANAVAVSPAIDQGPRTSITAAAARPAGVAPGPLPRSLVVVGDSVGMTLVLNAPDGLEASFTLVDGSVEGCGVVEGRVTSARGMRRDLGAECAGWDDEWAQAARDAGAQLALVTVGAWEVFDLDVDGEHLTFGSDAWDGYVRAQLERGVEALLQAGAQVALLEVPCFRPVDGGGLVALPERGDDTRTRHLNELLRAVAAGDPDNVSTVPSPAQYCTDESLATDLGHRWDGVHYYRPGAQLVWETITGPLLSIPV